MTAKIKPLLVSLFLRRNHRTFSYSFCKSFASTKSFCTSVTITNSAWKMNDNVNNDSQQIKEHIALDDKNYIVCSVCNGQGKVSQPPTRKQKLRLKRTRSELGNSNNDNNDDDLTVPPRLEPCHSCQTSGLQESPTVAPINNTLPSVAIVGGGLAGLALAAACRHRGIPCTVYERDVDLSERSQGYGLTMQQAAKALASLGIPTLGENGIKSTWHVVHKEDGTIVGEWGLRRWGRPTDKKQPRRQNVHVARQLLRHKLWQAAGGENSNIEWNHKLINYEEGQDEVVLHFQVGEKTVKKVANVLVGADGIRSQVRQQLLGEDATPLRYLGCLVVLGIVSIPESWRQEYALLDGSTVFQTADGTTRIYAMPYSKTESMWQLSFPMDEKAASEISQQGPQALLDESLKRCGTWHEPIPTLLRATPTTLVTGYPVYDRELSTLDQLTQSTSRVTIIGDACHCMSPFKGQGANQALLDALSLARKLSTVEKSKREQLVHCLKTFAEEMLERSAVKVKASAEAARFLHTDVAIQEGNMTRGAVNKTLESNAR